MLVVVTILLATSGILIVDAGEINIALNKPCMMSDQGPRRAEKYPCEKGNDGNTNQTFREGSCFKSNKADMNFWMVGLVVRYNITRIRIFNRLYTGENEAKYIYVYVGNYGNEDTLTEVGAFDQLPDIADIEVPPGTRGDIVKIVQKDPENVERKLMLCEIEVYIPEECIGLFSNC